MRRGELLNLRLIDVNLEKNTCLVKGKTGERWTFFNEVCHDALNRYLKFHRLPQELERSLIANQLAPLWLTEDGHPLSYESVSNITRQIERLSGVKFHLHSLRHTFATWMINKTDVYTVQRLPGPSSIKTTEQYLWTNRESRARGNYRPHSPLDALAGGQSGLKRRRGRPRRQ
jgi:integrase